MDSPCPYKACNAKRLKRPIVTRPRPTTQGSCQSCGALSDHTNVPEVAQCNNAQGQYMTVAHTQQAGHVTTGTR